jgi:hypothetical protein
MPTRHHVTTLAAISSRPKSEILTAREVLEHSCTAFHPNTCGLRVGAATVAAALIGYGGTRSLLGQRRGRGDRYQLLPLHRHVTTLDHCFDSSSAALCI